MRQRERKTDIEKNGDRNDQEDETVRTLNDFFFNRGFWQRHSTPVDNKCVENVALRRRLLAPVLFPVSFA